MVGALASQNKQTKKSKKEDQHTFEHPLFGSLCQNHTSIKYIERRLPSSTKTKQTTVALEGCKEGTIFTNNSPIIVN